MLIEEIKYFMIVIGAWNLNLTENSSLKTVQFWYQRTLQSTWFIVMVLLFVKLIQLIVIRAHTPVIFASVSITLTVLGIGAKIIIYEKNDVSNLFLRIINEEEKIGKSLDREVITSYNKDINVCIKFKNIAIFGILVAIPVFFIPTSYYALTHKAANKSENEFIEESFLFPIWLPYKESDILLWVIMLNLIMTFVGVNIYLAGHVTIFALMIFTAAQLRILQMHIRRIGSGNYEDTSHSGALGTIIRKHLFIISLVRELNKKARYIMLIEFLVNSISIALVITELLMQSSIIEPAMHLVLHVINVFPLAWFANEIMVQSLVLGDALYETKWYNQDVRTQKLLIIMIQLTQQPLTLTMGPFGPMTLVTALKTLQAAYSYIMFIRTFN